MTRAILTLAISVPSGYVLGLLIAKALEPMGLFLAITVPITCGMVASLVAWKLVGPHG